MAPVSAVVSPLRGSPHPFGKDPSGVSFCTVHVAELLPLSLGVIGTEDIRSI